MIINMVPYVDENRLTPKQYRINQCIWQFDVDCRRYDALWGVDRLPALCGEEMREKWRSQIDKLNTAIQKESVRQVEELVTGCSRGFEVMDKQARENGHTPTIPTSMQTSMKDGSTLIIATSGPDAENLKELHPDATIYTLKEIANLLHQDKYALVNKTKEILGGDIKEIRTKFEDDIPF